MRKFIFAIIQPRKTAFKVTPQKFLLLQYLSFFVHNITTLLQLSSISHIDHTISGQPADNEGPVTAADTDEGLRWLQGEPYFSVAPPPALIAFSVIFPRQYPQLSTNSRNTQTALDLLVHKHMSELYIKAMEQ